MPRLPAGRDRGLGLRARQPAAVRRAAPHRRAPAGRNPAPARAGLRGGGRRSCTTSGRSSWDAAWSRSAPMWIPCSRVFCRPGPWRGLSYAQVLYTLPVSLFGMSVSAAELPAMASAVGSESERADYLRGRLDGGLRQIAFFVVPSAMAFLALGDVVAGALYQIGRVHPGHDGVRLGDPGGLRGRTARVHHGPALRLDLLRAARHQDPAPLCGAPGGPHDRPGLPLRPAAAESARSRATMGRRGTHRLRRYRGVDRVPSAPARAQRAGSARTGLPVAHAARLWGAAGVGAAGAWALRAVLPVQGRTRWSRQSRCSASSGWSISA